MIYIENGTILKDIIKKYDIKCPADYFKAIVTESSTFCIVFYIAIKQ